MERRLRNLIFFLLIGVSFGLWWHSLGCTLELALGNDAYTHILMIVPLGCALVYLDRDRLGTDTKRDVGVGLALLSGALLIAGFSKWGSGLTSDLRLSFSMFGLVTWWIGVLVLFFGIRTVRFLLFPLGFLFLIVPIPDSTVNWIIAWLQIQSASAARIIFHLAGVPVTQDGIMLSIPGLDIEVATQCSSIRSSLFLVITTMVLAHLFLASWWRKALVIAAAIPLAAIKNGLRIFVIGELTTRVDPGFLDGDFHHHGGIVFFAFALAMILLLIWIVRLKESTQAATETLG